MKIGHKITSFLKIIRMFVPLWNQKQAYFLFQRTPEQSDEASELRLFLSENRRAAILETLRLPGIHNMDKASIAIDNQGLSCR